MSARNDARSDSSKDKLTQKAVLRNWHLLNILSKHEKGISINDLAVECQAKHRTIQRDLKDLGRVGFAFESRTGPHGIKFWRLKGGLIPTINLTWAEAAAIYLGRRLMEPLAGTYLFTSAQEAYKKLAYAFDKPTLKYIEKLAHTFYSTKFGTINYSDYGETLDHVMIAIEDRKPLTLGYHAQNVTEPVTREVYPLTMVYHKGTLYLIAWAVDRAAIRNFKINRISTAQVEPGSLPFNPIDFDLEKYLEGSFGIYQGEGNPVTVKISFHPDVVRYVEEKEWHKSQILTRQSDGTLIATFQLTNFQEVKSWVLGFGHQAEILEPQSLRDEIADTIRAMSQLYASSAESSQDVEQKRTPTQK